MLLSIVVNLSSTVNGTQSALQATSPLGPWFHYTVPPKQIPGLNPVNQTSSPSLYCHAFQYRKHTTCSTSTNYLGMWILPSQTIFLFLRTLRVKYQAFFQLLARFLSSDVQFPTFLYILEAKQAWEHEFWSLSNGHKTKARDKFVFWSQSQRHVCSGSSQTAQFARKGWRNCDPWTSVFSLGSIWVHFLKVLLWVEVPRQKPQGLWHLASRS